MHAPISKSELKFAREVAQAVVEGAFKDGHIRESDLLDPNLVLAKLKSLLKNGKVDLIIDHRQTVLEAAIKNQTDGQAEFSLLFYATFFEHTINHLISGALRHKNMSGKYIGSVIRTTNIESKLGWLLQLLELPAFNEKHRNTIQSIANERNAFVHYKWNATPDDDKISDAELTRIETLLVAGRRAATYIRGYESRYFFRNNKKMVKKVTRRRP